MQAVRGCRLSAVEADRKTSLFHVACFIARFALGNLDTSLFALVSSSPCSCMGVACGAQRIGLFREILRALLLVRQWIHALREALYEFTHFLRCGELESRGVWPPFSQIGEACTVDASGCSFSQRGSHLEVEHYFCERSIF